VRIAGIAAAFPSRIVSNDDVLELIARESRASFHADLAKSRVLERIRQLLNHSGIKQRRWSLPDETPIDLLAQAIAQALGEAACEPGELDLLVYTGVGGGFCEPGNAYMVAHALGMRRAQCFDVRDACNSWSRALRLIDCTFRVDPAVRRALVVNAEFNMYEGGPGVPDLFRLRHAGELDFCFPAYTIGEAATATLLVNEPEREWEFHFASRPDLADLCVIPESNYRGYCALGLDGPAGTAAERIGRNGAGRFTSFGSELSAHGTPEVVALFRRLTIEPRTIRKIFPHASSRRDWDHAAGMLGVRHLMFHIYPDYGNVVSASVPAGIALAKQRGEIEPGDRLVAWVASAGMSFSVCSFVL
jgi:3-oxoacyl-[acyl-carrier-protein] synthase III